MAKKMCIALAFEAIYSKHLKSVVGFSKKKNYFVVLKKIQTEMLQFHKILQHEHVDI